MCAQGSGGLKEAKRTCGSTGQQPRAAPTCPNLPPPAPPRNLADHVVNLRIMDASSAGDPTMQSGVELIVFSRDPGSMPQAAAPADIIRLQNVMVRGSVCAIQRQVIKTANKHKCHSHLLRPRSPAPPLQPPRTPTQPIQVQFWGGRIQLMGQLANHRPFSYLMFSGAAGAPDVPYRLGGGREAGWQVGASTVNRLLTGLSTQSLVPTQQSPSPLRDRTPQVTADDSCKLSQLRTLAAQSTIQADEGGFDGALRVEWHSAVRRPMFSGSTIHQYTTTLRPTHPIKGPQTCYLRKVMDLTLPAVNEAATALFSQQQLQPGQQQPAALQPVFTSPEVLDMRCKVLAIDSRNPVEPVLYVWDSTDARPMPCG
jgi:hypothetical protein